MRYFNYNDYHLGGGLGLFNWIILLVIIDVVLRGLALWKSARKGQNVWFVFLLIVNSLGILPLIYLITNRSEVKPKPIKSTSKKSSK